MGEKGGHARRALLVVNQSAATGHAGAIIDGLSRLLLAFYGAAARVEVVREHAAASLVVARFLQESSEPALVLAGGGGGTLRAVVEAVCGNAAKGALPRADQVQLAALRLGSGNVLAKQLGVPPAPEEALASILANERARRTVACSVMRFELGSASGCNSRPAYGVTLGGLGQFGRIPGDLERWHRRFPLLRTVAARLLGVEKLTTVEYGVAMLARSLWCAVQPSRLEEVTVVRDRERMSFRLWAGAIQTFRLSALPFEPGIGMEDGSIAIHLMPYQGRLATLTFWLWPGTALRRAVRFVAREGEKIEIHLVDRVEGECFIDEDLVTFQRRLTVEVAGRLVFVPGSLYRAPYGTEEAR